MDPFEDLPPADDTEIRQVATLDDFGALSDANALPPPAAASGSSAGASSVGGIGDLAAVFEVPVRVQAVLGRARMPIGELLRMKSGMVIELDRKVGEPVDIFVNDRLIARGEVVLIDDSLGITLTEIVQQER